MTAHRLGLTACLRAICLIIGLSGNAAFARPLPTGSDAAPLIVDDEGPGLTRLAQAQPAPTAPIPPPAAAPAPSPAQDEPIGNVATLTGVATVIRNKDSIALKLKDDIFLDDTVQTAADSSLGITFNDATTFNLSANARITIDTYVYEDGGNQNAGIFDIGKGTVAFVAAAVARTGDMKITTPTSTLGIRGTTGLVEVPEGGGNNNVNIKLYPDADGHVGRIEVSDRSGARLGALTQGASGFTVRRVAAGGRVTAVPLTISPQQAARDQGFVRQVHAAQSVGRQIVTEQRALRRANPSLNRPGLPRPQRPQAPQRQNNNLPGQNRPGQPGALPNRQGRGQPGARPQPQPQAAPNRQGSHEPTLPGRSGRNPQAGGKPGTTQQPAIQPRPSENPRQGGQPGRPSRPNNLHEPAFRQGGPAQPRPGAQRPVRPGRPTFAPPRRPPPKGKKQRPR